MQYPAQGESLKLQYDEIVLQFSQTSFTMGIMGEVRGLGFLSGTPEWINGQWLFPDDVWDVMLYVTLTKNDTSYDRTCVMFFYDYYDGQYPLTIVHKAWCSIVEFADPEMKKVCVEAYDADGDGELSFYEASCVDDMSGLLLEGRNIRSFDEFCFFTNVKALPNGLFAGSGIKSSFFNSHSGDVESGNGTFMNCKELTDVNLYRVKVGERAFMECVSLKDIFAKVIGESAFEGCTALETVLQNDTYIPKRAFKGCTALCTVEFVGDEQICTGSHIGEEAFYGCTALPTITIPDNINEIGDRAFADCTNLSSVHLFPKIPPTLGNDVFAGVHSDFKIYVHPTLTSTYQKAWPSLADRICASDQ